LSTRVTTERGQINSAISTVETAVSDEESARASAVNTLDSRITTEKNTLNASISNVQGTVTSETSARASADNTLDARITSEKNTLNASITSVQDAVTDEAGARASADTSLNTRITSEVGTLNASIDTVESAVSTETNARATAITNLRSEISGSSGTIDSKITSYNNTLVSPSGAIATKVDELETSLTGPSGPIAASSQLAQDAQTTADGAASSAASLSTRVDTVEGSTSAQVGINSGFNTRTGVLESKAFLKASNTTNGVTTVTGIEVGGVENAIRMQGDILTLTDTSGSLQLHYANGRWNFAGDISAATGEFGGVISGRLESPQIQMIGASIMKVELISGFGPDALTLWKGPRILLSSGQPDLSALRKSNALIWEDTLGNAYFGGTLSAGISKEAAQTTNKNLNQSLILGPFDSQGGPRIVTVSFYMNAATQPSGTCPTNPTQPSGTLTLERDIGTGWVQVTGVSMSGTTTTERDFEENECIITESISRSINTTDNAARTGAMRYRVTVSGQQRYHALNDISNQNMSIISVEE